MNTQWRRIRKALGLLFVLHLVFLSRIEPADTTKAATAGAPPIMDSSPATGFSTGSSDADALALPDDPGPGGTASAASTSKSAPESGKAADPEDLEVESSSAAKPAEDDALGLPDDPESPSESLKDKGAEGPSQPERKARENAGTEDPQKTSGDQADQARPGKTDADASVPDGLELTSDPDDPETSPAPVLVAPSPSPLPPALAAKPVPAAPASAEAPPELPSESPPAEPQQPATAKVAPAPDVMMATKSPAPVNESPNQITNLEFKMEGTKSRLIVSSVSPLRYREVRNAQMKQVVYFFENTQTPLKLQRAYDTTEFASPVALFTLLQMPQESPALSKLIIQLREGNKPPTVVPNDRGLYVEFPPSDLKPDQKITLGDNEPLSGEENIYSGAQSYSGKTIQRLEIKNSDVQDVLRLIARSSGYNIVIGDDVTGKVGTLSLENIPWDQAFALVLQSKKLGYIRTGNVLRVGTLNSLKNEKEEALANEQTRIKVEPLRILLIPVSYAKATELAPQAKHFLTGRGTIDVDIRSNTIIVKDIEKVVARVQKLYSKLDTQPPRVSISAKFVEVDETFTHDLGLTLLTASQNIGGLNISATSGTSSPNGFGTPGGVISTIISASQFANLSTSLTIGETEDKVRMIANPSVAVVANQLANVNQSLTFFIPIEQVVGGGVTNSYQQVTTNLTLQVTPIVAGDGSIFMTVHIHNDIPSGTGASTTVDGRDVSTQILIENGDTAVVGGIFSSTLHTNRTGLPLLMNVPILGYFAANNHTNGQRNELFVFLTAKIMNTEEAFKRTF